MTVIITSTLRGGNSKDESPRETNHHRWGMRWQRPHKAIVEASYIYTKAVHNGERTGMRKFRTHKAGTAQTMTDAYNKKKKKNNGTDIK